MPDPAAPVLPYKIAVLCELHDDRGRTLLIRRAKAPNFGLCSPIGGKLDTHTGESPLQCARREIQEEAGIEVPIERIRIAGIISEASFEGAGHWLIFWCRVMGPVRVTEQTIREGSLEWHEVGALDSLPLPETDRKIIWPLVRKHVRETSGFFAVHIDCAPGSIPGSAPGSPGAPGTMHWAVEQADAPIR